MQSIRGKTIFVTFVAVLYAATGGVFYLAATREYHPVAGFEGIRLTMVVLLMPLLVKYVFQLACSPLYWIKCRMQKKRMDGQVPSVSVLVPAWNEEVGAAAAYRRNVLLEMGGFDHSIITEDIEMSARILSHG